MPALTFFGFGNLYIFLFGFDFDFVMHLFGFENQFQYRFQTLRKIAEIRKLSRIFAFACQFFPWILLKEYTF